jgi:hypothetical protein
MNFPTANKTWVYDVASKLWHERDWWNQATGLYERIRNRVHCFAFGKHLVGDRETGVVYEENLTTYDDNGVHIQWRRRAPYLSNESKRVFYPRLDLEIEVGQGISGDPRTAPTVVLRTSDDYGSTWGRDMSASLGAQGEYGRRVYWPWLGSGYGRVFELAGADKARVAIVDAAIDPAAGMH